jgi:tetraacyldisaccharide 4'-kinase
MREPLSALRRASVAVLRVEDEAFAPELRRLFPGLPLWSMTREIMLETAEGTAVAFCGIAHPREFFASLTRAGVSLAGSQAFRDHHAYTDADVAGLVRSVGATGARTLLTTEKDMVRLSAGQRAALGQSAELVAVPLRARLRDEDAALTQLLSLAGLPPV